MGGGSNRHATASRAQQSRPSKSPGCRRDESCTQSHNALPSREGTSEVLGLRRLLPMYRLGVHLYGDRDGAPAAETREQGWVSARLCHWTAAGRGGAGEGGGALGRQAHLTALAQGLRVGALLLAGANDNVDKSPVVLQALLGAAGQVLLLLTLSDLGRLAAHLAGTSQRTVDLALRTADERGGRASGGRADQAGAGRRKDGHTCHCLVV